MKQALTLIFLFMAIPLIAAPDPFSVSHLGMERGLSNNHVVGIAQDKHGFIWIATDEGLNRFDGHNFKTFFKDELTEKPSLTGNELNGITDDPVRPVIWIATQRGGLDSYNYDTDTFRSYRHDDNDPSSLITDDVTSVSPAADGGIWVTTFWGGVDHLNPDTGVFTHYNASTVKGLPRAAIWQVSDGGNGFLYVAHEHAGFSIIDLKRMTARNFVPDASDPYAIPAANVQCVYRDSLNNIWLGAASGLVLFNPDDNSFVDFSQRHPSLAHSVSDIRQFADNRLWVAMERGGVAVIDLSDSTFSSPTFPVTTFRSGTGAGELSSPSVRCLFQDNFTNVWAGTWGGGLNLVSSMLPAFRLLDGPLAHTDGVNTSSSVFTAICDNDGRLWIGRDGALDIFEAGKKIKSMSMANGLPGDIVQASCKSADGSLWFGFFNAGAVRIDPSTGACRQIFPKGINADVRDVTPAPDGSIMLATSGGIWRHDPKTGTTEKMPTVGNNLIRKILPYGNGFIVGTFGGGLIMTDDKFKEIRKLDINNGLPSNTINDVFFASDGSLWVATGEGLLKFPDINRNPGEFSIINRASGLSNSHVQAIAQDRSGAIWISTNTGISCIRGERISNYSHRDHVPLGNFLGRSVCADPQGNLYFGAISGLCTFNPVKVLEEQPLPRSVIVEIALHDANGHPGSMIQATGKEKIKLSPGQNSFDVTFTSANFALADEVEYAYMLEGLDDTWIMTRDINVATFRDIPSGSYTFKVKTRIRNQEWGEPAELRIVLPPPFWRSWLANIIIACLGGAVVGILLYLYKKRVNAEAQLTAEKERHLHEKDLNEERLRFYTNITHELRTPLSLIMGPLEDLADDGNIPEKERRSLDMVRRNASRLLDLVNSLLEFRKTETQNRRLCVRKGNIASTVFEAALKYKELNRNRKVTVNVSATPHTIDALYDKEVITIALDNLISNALKYTSEGHVDINCHLEGDKVVISVADTGMGIGDKALPHIFERYYQEQGPHQAAGTGIGLSLVKNLITLHHGSIGVESRENEGTTFTIVIPAEGSYPEALHTEEITDTTDSTTSGEQQEDASEAADGGKPVVLVVEDNADIRDYIRQAFTDLYDVHCAEDGKEGLEEANRLMPSIIVSDIMMPVMDGIEMTRRLKQDVRTSHIPVILLTAKQTSADREEGYGVGADSYLTKPFSSSLLQSRINNILLQRMKLTERFASRPAAPVQADEGDSLKEKKERLLHSLSEVDKEFVEKLTKTITDNIPAENVDVNFLSAALCMSSSTLYRKVKAVTGVSPNEFIRKTKMQMAENLLLGGHYNFSEIAFKVGINSVTYFRQCFKEEFGMTPSDYLKRINQN